MQRLLVTILAAVDAAIAAAVGLAVLLAPLTLLWTLAFGATADWGALWPLTGTLWQFGHGVPLQVEIADELVVAVGVSPDAASFTLSVTPMLLLLFTLLFAARSGARAARAGAWLLGVVSGTVVFAALAAGVAVTGHLGAAQTPLWLGIVLPAFVYLVGGVCGAVRHAWEEGDGGVIDRLHDLFDSWGHWGLVPVAAVRGAAFAIVGLVGVGALLVAALTVLRGGAVVALFEAARVDALGAGVITLGQLAYLPTIIVWTIAWIAGPGFAVGTGTAVSPAGTQLGVVPGVPVFGLLPDGASFWMLIVVLIPIAAGAVAGWAVRSRLVWEGEDLTGAQQASIAASIAALSAAVAAIAAVFASGSIGPGRLADVGPDPAALALAIGIEVFIGAAIMLVSPRHRDELAEERTDRWRSDMAASDFGLDQAGARAHGGADAIAHPDLAETADLSDVVDLSETAPLDLDDPH